MTAAATLVHDDRDQNEPHDASHYEPAVIPDIDHIFVDYYGVLDCSQRARKDWESLLSKAVSAGQSVCVVYRDATGLTGAFIPVAEFINGGHATRAVSLPVDDPMDSSLTKSELQHVLDKVGADASSSLYVAGDVVSSLNATLAGCLSFWSDVNEDAVNFTQNVVPTRKLRLVK